MLILLHNVMLRLDWWFCLPNAPDIVGSVLLCILNLPQSSRPHSLQQMGTRLHPWRLHQVGAKGGRWVLWHPLGEKLASDFPKGLTQQAPTHPALGLVLGQLHK